MASHQYACIKSGKRGGGGGGLHDGFVVHNLGTSISQPPRRAAERVHRAENLHGKISK